MKFDLISRHEFEFDDTATTVSMLDIDPTEFWNSRHELHEAMVKSMEIYDGMGSEERVALISKVRRALAVMHDKAEDWIPDGLSMDKSGRTIRIELNLLAAEIDKEVQLLDQATSFEVKQTVEKTRQALAEIAAEGPTEMSEDRPQDGER